MTQSRLDRRRRRGRAPENWMLAALLLAACGEPRTAAVPFDPSTAANEDGDAELDLVLGQPAMEGSDEPEGSADAPGEPDETGGEAPPELGQPVPTIEEPGFPAGSPPRLVPAQFVGPISGRPVLFNI